MSHYWPREVYKSLDALESAKKIVAEAAAGIGDKTRTITTSAIPEVLGAVGGIGAGVGIGLLGVYAAGTTGLSPSGSLPASPLSAQRSAVEWWQESLLPGAKGGPWLDGVWAAEVAIPTEAR